MFSDEKIVKGFKIEWAYELNGTTEQTVRQFQRSSVINYLLKDYLLQKVICKKNYMYASKKMNEIKKYLNQNLKSQLTL